MSVELADITRFLAATAPFDVLDEAAIDALAAQLSERYFRRGTEIIAPGQVGTSLFIIRSGAVEIFDRAGTLLDTRDAGECCGNSTINGTGPSRYRMVAAADTLALVVPQHVLDDVHSRFAQVREFFDAQTMAVAQSAIDARLAQTDGAGGAVTLGELLGRAAVSVPPDTPITQAAQVMTDARVSSLLIVDAAGDLAGIVTDRDLRTRVLAAGVDVGTAVENVMTAAPCALDAAATVFDAALEMMDRGFHHLPVVAVGGDGAPQRPLGVVSSTDLVRIAHADPIYLAGRIARATSVADMARTTARIPDMIAGLARRGVTAEEAGRIYTAAMDAATRRVVALAEQRLGPTPIPLCWVAVGSQARRELGVSSDQDNALIVAREPSDEENAYLVDFTRQVNRDIAEIGLPRCQGLVEASNPTWRKTPHQWIEAARDWVTRPEAHNMLEAQTFFDMRALAGDQQLCDTTRAGMLAAAQSSARFHAYLARGAAEWQPPLGFFRGLVVKRRGEHRNTLDIKAGGLAAVVQSARLLALATGSTDVATVARLRAAQSSGALHPADADRLIAAFETLRRVQFRHHAECIRARRAPDNNIDPAQLSAWDRRDLRQAFAAVAEHLNALGLRYPVRHM